MSIGAEPSAPYDVNAVIGGLLRDLAFAQTSEQKMFGYKRAASAVLALDRPITELVSGRTMERIPGVEWSDGVPSLVDIVEACIGRGYGYAAVTDHSYGLKIAGGMSMDEVARQHAAIDALNRSQPSFRLIKGIEANISADGRLDLSDDEAAAFELVLAAPHSKLRLAADQTARLVRAVQTAGVHVLAHPRGRITGSRPGIHADWDAVFAAAAAAGVAVEIDGDPSRQDLDYTLAARALDAGCLFAADGDAHTTGQLAYADTALAHARLARIPADRIINCWTTDRLLAWLRDRRPAAALGAAPRATTR